MIKKLLLAAGVMCSFSCMAQNKDAAILKQLNADWIASYKTRDTAAISSIFADDLVLTNPAGKTFHKQDILRSTMSPAQEFIASKVDTVSVRLLGSGVGIINAEVTSTVKLNGETNVLRTDYMDVYEKRRGRWYVVAAHVTLLQ